MRYRVTFDTNGVQPILLLDENQRRSCLATPVRRFVLCPRVPYRLSRVGDTG